MAAWLTPALADHRAGTLSHNPTPVHVGESTTISLAGGVWHGDDTCRWTEDDVEVVPQQACSSIVTTITRTYSTETTQTTGPHVVAFEIFNASGVSSHTASDSFEVVAVEPEPLPSPSPTPTPLPTVTETVIQPALTAGESQKLSDLHEGVLWALSILIFIAGAALISHLPRMGG
ncbi:MAG: hypothetical protein LC808_23905 [Actinobacteria bacterium]|nr:hypothetical protein [Actinomycetota bacterium]